jgi:hypothetical protein
LGTGRWTLALDANALTYWIDAMNAAPDEPSGPLAEEKLALVRIFFWMPSQSCFGLVPTVKAEYEAIPNRAKLEEHIGWALTHTAEVQPSPDEALITKRAYELTAHRAGVNDRKIVAECELSGISALLTCDGRLVERLRLETRVWLVRPSEFWDRLRVAKGSPPNRTPPSGNPLLECSWWHW